MSLNKSLYKRKRSPYWWLKLGHNGRVVRESTGTANVVKAREYRDKRKAQLWDEVRLGMKPNHTWVEARDRWLTEKAHKKSIELDGRNFGWLGKHLNGCKLTEIDRAMVDRITQKRIREGVGNATTNRTLALLRSVLRAARDDWEWLERVPKIRLLPEPKGRTRFLSREEEVRLLRRLPLHLRAMVRFSLLTGLRQRNVRELRWSHVDLDRPAIWVDAEEAKGGTGIAVPLADKAARVVAAQRGKHPTYVFTFRGRPVRWVNNTAWKSALHKAGIENFRWHDLRHTWATRHNHAGTPMHVLQELGGWKSPVMVQRYAHHSTAHLASHVDAFERHLRRPGHNPGTLPEGGKKQGA